LAIELIIKVWIITFGDAVNVGISPLNNGAA
jgi:hypothetical protein